MEVAGADTAAAKLKGRRTKPQLNVIFDDALEAFISVLDQHSLADMAQSRGAVTQAGAPPGPRRRSTKSAAKPSPSLRG